MLRRSMSSDKLSMKRKASTARGSEESSGRGTKTPETPSKKLKLSVEEQRERARKWAEETLHSESTPEKSTQRMSSRAAAEAQDNTPEKPRRNSAGNLKQLAKEVAIAEKAAEDSLKTRRRSGRAAEAVEAAAISVRSSALDSGVKTRRASRGEQISSDAPKVQSKVSEGPVTRRSSKAEGSAGTPATRRSSRAVDEDVPEPPKTRGRSSKDMTAENAAAHRNSKFDSPQVNSFPRYRSFSLVGLLVDIWAAGWDFYWYHYKFIVSIAVLSALSYFAYKNEIHHLSVDELMDIIRLKVMQLRDASITIFSGIFGVFVVLYLSSAIYKRRQRYLNKNYTWP